MCIHMHVELEKSYAMILNIPRTLFYIHVRCAFHDIFSIYYYVCVHVYWCVCLITTFDLSLGTSETRRQLKMAMKRGKGKTSITKVCYG